MFSCQSVGSSPRCCMYGFRLDGSTRLALQCCLPAAAQGLPLGTAPSAPGQRSPPALWQEQLCRASMADRALLPGLQHASDWLFERLGWSWQPGDVGFAACDLQAGVGPGGGRGGVGRGGGRAHSGAEAAARCVRAAGCVAAQRRPLHADALQHSAQPAEGTPPSPGTLRLLPHTA